MHLCSASNIGINVGMQSGNKFAVEGSKEVVKERRSGGPRIVSDWSSLLC